MSDLHPHPDVSSTAVEIRNPETRVTTELIARNHAAVWLTPDCYIMLSSFLTPEQQAEWCDHAAAELLGLSVQIRDRAAAVPAL